MIPHGIHPVNTYNADGPATIDSGVKTTAVQIVLTGLLALMAGTPTFGAEPAANLDLAITLENAVMREKGPRNDVVGMRDLLVSVVRENGTWREDVLGFVVAFNRGSQKGLLTGTKIEENRIEFELDMPIEGDWIVPGGPGKYRVMLQREGSGYKGSFTGTFNDKPVSGAAHVWASPAVMLPGDTPIGHPRLALRQADIPALRARSMTPQGQLVVKRLRELLATWDASQSASSAAGGHALLRALSGEARDAAAARTLAKYSLENELAYQNWMSLGAHLRNLALAYDLCFDAWDEPFRVHTANVLRRWGSDMMEHHDRNGNGIKHDPGHPWQAHVRSSAALCNLVVLGDRMMRSDAELPELKVAAQPPGFEPGRGVPVVPFGENQTPGQWIFAGPFPPLGQAMFAAGEERSEGDYLASLGGPERAFPAVGTQIAWDDTTRAFQRLPAIHARPDERGNIFVDVYNASGQLNDTTWYYYTVIHNDRERYLGINIHQRNSIVWMAGQKLTNNLTVCMKPGYIPLMIQVSAGRGKHWDLGVIGTRFWEYEKEQGIGNISWRRELQQRGHLETDPGIQRQLRVGRLLVGRFMYDHGRNPAHRDDFTAGLEPLMQLLLAWRNVSGGEPWHPDLPALPAEGLKLLGGGESPAAFQQPHEAIYRLMGVPLP